MPPHLQAHLRAAVLPVASAITLAEAMELHHQAQIARALVLEPEPALARRLDLLVELAGGVVELLVAQPADGRGADLAGEARTKSLYADLVTIGEDMLTSEDTTGLEMIAAAVQTYLDYRGGSALVEQAEASEQAWLAHQLVTLEDRAWRTFTALDTEQPTPAALAERGRAIKTLMLMLAAPQLELEPRIEVMLRAHAWLSHRLTKDLVNRTAG